MSQIHYKRGHYWLLKGTQDIISRAKRLRITHEVNGIALTVSPHGRAVIYPAGKGSTGFIRSPSYSVNPHGEDVLYEFEKASMGEEPTYWFKRVRQDV